jgi:PcfJ-like protein
MAPQPRAAPVTCRPELESQIRRFPRGYRRRLRKLARGSSRLGELLYTFPGLAMVLAAGSRTLAARREALSLVKGGKPLARAAEALELPRWLRRLPPEAFEGPLGALPGSEAFGRRILNEIPRGSELTPLWLRWTLFAAESCDEDFAVWVARQKIGEAPCVRRLPLLPLAAFAWHSSQGGIGVAMRLIANPWGAWMRFDTAVSETRSWLERIVFARCCEHPSPNNRWFQTQQIGGHIFTPLRSLEQLRAEGQTMNNCVASYARRASLGACLIYSVRRGARRAATMEIAPRRGRAAIVQLLAASNSSAGEEIWRAAREWLAKQGEYPFAAYLLSGAPVIASRWHEVWTPYCAAKPQFRDYLFEPSIRNLDNLRNDMTALALLVERI